MNASQTRRLLLPCLIGLIGLLALISPVGAANPDVDGDYNSPCYVEGKSYAAPYAGLASYSRTSTGCTKSPWGARLESYFWDGAWFGFTLTDPSYAYYSRTIYSAAVEGWHENYFFPVSPYQRFAHTYAP